MNIKKIILISLSICMFMFALSDSYAVAVEQSSNTTNVVNNSQKTSEKATNSNDKIKKTKKDNTIQLKAKRNKNKDVVKLEAPKKVLVTKISFDEVLAKAIEHSYDLKIADFNVLIAKQGVRGARSEYFPKLVATAATEYTKNYRDVAESTVMSIGESFINPYTRFQSVMGVSISYNLFDFGVRRGNLDAAKEDVFIKELETEQKRQDLNLTIIDTYSKILMLIKQLELYKEIVVLETKNLEYRKRLFDAQEISKTEYNDQVVKVEEVNKKIYEIKQSMSESLNWLAFYTGDSYDIENLKVADFGRADFDSMDTDDYTKSVTWKIYEKQLRKKGFEIKVAQRTNYPKLNAYSRYYLYGSNYNSYNKSLKDIEPSNLSVGASVNWMLFDGMKNRANVEKNVLEYKQLQVERDKAIAELMTKLATMRSNLMYLDKQIETNYKIIKELGDKETSVHRLVSQKLVSPMDENDAKIKVMEQRIELAKNTVTENALQRGIKVLTYQMPDDTDVKRGRGK